MTLRIPVATLVAFALSAPAAQADTSYGGAAVRNGAQNGPAIGLTVRDDGSIAGRVSFTYGCRRQTVLNVAARVAGRANGATFTASGRTNPGSGASVVRFRLSGTLAPDAATGRIRLLNRCANQTRNFVLRAASAPAGAPVAAPANTLFLGVTGQSASGVRTPVILRVARNGRVRAITYATADCGRMNWSVSNATPSTTPKPDGTFSRNERYTIRYRGGAVERYRVNVAGRFLADGATGTFRIRLTYRKGRTRIACDSGTQTWTARP